MYGAGACPCYIERIEFTYDYLRQLLAAAKSRFDVFLLRDAERALATSRRRFFLRHDIDVSLEHALQLAHVEADAGVPATFMFIVDSDLYDLSLPESRGILREIDALGHEVAVHFDSAKAPREAHTVGALEVHIEQCCRRLEEFSGVAVGSVSFHRPVQWLLRGPLHVCGRVNAYAADLMTTYLSDSKGVWREGDPLPRIQNDPTDTLQLLVHPIWWGARHVDGPDLLEQFFKEKTYGANAGQTKRFSELMAITVPGVLRRGA